MLCRVYNNHLQAVRNHAVTHSGMPWQKSGTHRMLQRDLCHRFHHTALLKLKRLQWLFCIPLLVWQCPLGQSDGILNNCQDVHYLFVGYLHHYSVYWYSQCMLHPVCPYRSVAVQQPDSSRRCDCAVCRRHVQLCDEPRPPPFGCEVSQHCSAQSRPCEAWKPARPGKPLLAPKCCSCCSTCAFHLAGE